MQPAHHRQGKQEKWESGEVPRPAWNFAEDMCSMPFAIFIPLLDEHCTYEAIIAELLDVHEFRASVQVFRDRVIDVVCSIQFTGVHISICLCWGQYIYTYIYIYNNLMYILYTGGLGECHIWSRRIVDCV